MFTLRAPNARFFIIINYIVLWNRCICTENRRMDYPTFPYVVEIAWLESNKKLQRFFFPVPLDRVPERKRRWCERSNRDSPRDEVRNLAKGKKISYLRSWLCLFHCLHALLGYGKDSLDLSAIKHFLNNNWRRGFKSPAPSGRWFVQRGSPDSIKNLADQCSRWPLLISGRIILIWSLIRAEDGWRKNY